MLSESEARARILAAVTELPATNVPLLDARDRFAAEDYFARLPMPLFDNSAMDGYAVIASDCKTGARLRVIGEQAAGVDQKLKMAKGEAIRIFTGAPMPAGADAVIMQEDVARQGDEITLNASVEPGEFIRAKGCDLSEGQKIVAKGDRLRSTKIALLASQGLSQINVGSQVSVAIISTGDELAEPGQKLKPGQIYDSNSVLLRSIAERSGAIVAAVEHCRDDAGSLQKAFQSAQKNEILIVTGGVSVGEHDLVQSTLREMGAKIEIWRVAIKPGKPFLFGKLDNCLVFGLPGNPVSAFVTFLQFVRPAILKMMGASDLELPRVTAKISTDLTNDSERAHYIRGNIANGVFQPIGRQESHALFGLSQSNALLRLETGASIKANETVDVQVWE